MKQKIFFVLAALMMLTGTSAMAQSETLKGDVNGDGAVDVADIAAVIAIMKHNDDGKTKYYWYVGNTSPEGMTPPSVGNANATLCEWTELGTSLPTTSIKVYKEDENYDDHKWYVAAPTEARFTIYNYQDALPDGGIVYVKSFMIGNVSYDLWSNVNPAYNMAITLHK